MTEPHEPASARRPVGRGEVLGSVCDAKGDRVETDLSSRTIARSCEDPGFGTLAAVAGGTARVAALHAVLLSGLLHGLFTDERTARALVGPSPGA